MILYFNTTLVAARAGCFPRSQAIIVVCPKLKTILELTPDKFGYYSLISPLLFF
jgi:hypothetical protein